MPREAWTIRPESIIEMRELGPPAYQPRSSYGLRGWRTRGGAIYYSRRGAFYNWPNGERWPLFKSGPITGTVFLCTKEAVWAGGTPAREGRGECRGCLRSSGSLEARCEIPATVLRFKSCVHGCQNAPSPPQTPKPRLGAKIVPIQTKIKQSSNARDG